MEKLNKHTIDVIKSKWLHENKDLENEKSNDWALSFSYYNIISLFRKCKHPIDNIVSFHHSMIGTDHFFALFLA